VLDPLLPIQGTKELWLVSNEPRQFKKEPFAVGPCTWA
jgi:hypothetical protein